MNHRQNGVALVTAIMIVTITAAASINILSRLELDIRRSGNMINADQALRYGVAAEDFVAALLTIEGENTDIDHPGEEWAHPITLPLEDGLLQGRLIEQSGCFNLNNLDGKNAAEQRAQFRRLLSALNLDPQLADAVTDWVDPDSNETIPDGAEDGFYLSQTPAYRAANTVMESVTELRLIQGMSQEVYDKLLPHVCATPRDAPINVNTASIEVLMSLSEGFSRSSAEAVHAQIREFESPFESTQAFRTDSRVAGQEIKVAIDVNSYYFIAEATATIGNTRALQYSLMARDSKGNTVVISRSRGVY